jgi:anti-sigma B factor antagonist
MSASGRKTTHPGPTVAAPHAGGAYTVKNQSHPLQIRCDRDGVLWLSGEFDMAEIERFLRTATAHVDGRHEVVLDLSELTFLDSSGIRALLRFADFVCPKGVLLRNPSENVGTVLAITGVDGLTGVTVGRQQHPLSA